MWKGVGSNWTGFGGLDGVAGRLDCRIGITGQGRKNGRILAEVACAERYGPPVE